MNFDLLGALPQGTTVLEASAGTGKTYAIVGLATRYVAEGVAQLSELLLVTFSRAATAELRERTRERLSSTEVALADPATARRSPDELVRHLASGDDASVAAVRRRLRLALSDFDAATIATTHSFCQRMLDALGLAGERESNVTLVEALDDLVREVVADLYVRRYASFKPRMTLAEAHQVAKDAVGDRQAALVPEPDPETDAGQRVEFAAAVRAEVERRKRLGGIRDYDDLLVLLRDTLADPVHGPDACARIRERFRVVLVDEFQDTDPIQWEILRRAFHGTATLVLVGDPKQAIYAFRGAEVSSYLAAVAVANSTQALTTNWRSDAELLRALDHLYGGAALGDSRIVVGQVQASAGRAPAAATPLRLRYLPRAGAGPRKGEFPAVAALRARVAADAARDVVAALDGGAQPHEIAVLVRTRAQSALIREALQRAAVPSVLAGGTSVFDTPSATHWLWLLQALAAPHRADRVRLAALTPLLGWSATELDERGDEIVADVGGRLREWGTLFGAAGFAAVFERLSAATNLVPRLLETVGGERTLTDVRHIAQLLNRVSVDETLGIAALIRWLTARIEDEQSGVKDQVRRLDSDAAAVQITTVHMSKGLEFPRVYIPFAWDAAKNPTPSTVRLHDESGNRLLDVGGNSGPGYSRRVRQSATEDAGEELRLLYVAATRAKSHVVFWWAPSFSTGGAPLHRMIFGRDGASATVEPGAPVPADRDLPARFAEWATTDVIAVEPVGSGPVPQVTWTVSRPAPSPLAAASFDRVLDAGWRRTSYSALTAAVHELGHVVSEAEDMGTVDEPEDEPSSVLPLPEDAAETRLLSPMNDFPFGPVFGTLVHEVLEIVDTAAPDLSVELTRRAREAIAATLAEVDPAALAAALHLVMTTPLGYGSLAEVGPRDRLAELDFEIPLAGGEHPKPGRVTLRDIADLLRAHLPETDPLRPYAELLDGVEADPLRGYLSGSIDLVVRTPAGRFVVIDYKTNRIAPGELTVHHFGRDAMAHEMLRAHYPLQALLYSVALHRYLRWRLPGYRPSEHLGGVQYLFVRGMIGPETPAGCGVFDWSPPAALVEAVSDLLGGAR